MSGDAESYLDRSLLAMFLFVFCLSALKPWIGLVMTGVNQLITLFQFACLTMIVTIMNKRFYRSLDYFSLFFLLILGFKFGLESAVDIYESDLSALVSQTYVLVRALLMVYLFQVLIDCPRQDIVFKKIETWLIAYFSLTFIYCLMQSPFVFDQEWMRESGGNVVSSNFMGLFRANGGMGGTVIDYANFLLPLAWLIFYSEFKSKFLRYILLLMLFTCVFLNFSRVLILCLFLMGMIHALSLDSFKKVYTLAIAGSVIIGYLLTQIDEIISAYIEFAGVGDGFIPSDAKRLASWIALFFDFTILDYVGGRDLGGNTGFYISGAKISGDGFITGFIYDAGIVATFLLLAINYRRIIQIPCLFRIKLSLMLTLTTMMVVNSGYEKLFVLTIYCVVIAILNNHYRGKTRQPV